MFGRPQGESRGTRGGEGGGEGGRANSETCREAAGGEGPQVHKLSAVGAPYPLVLESPQSTLKALLIVSRHGHATESQALAHLSQTQIDLHSSLHWS